MPPLQSLADNLRALRDIARRLEMPRPHFVLAPRRRFIREVTTALFSVVLVVLVATAVVIIVFLLSIFLLSKGPVDKINFQRERFHIDEVLILFSARFQLKAFAIRLQIERTKRHCRFADQQKNSVS